MRGKKSSHCYVFRVFFSNATKIQCVNQQIGIIIAKYIIGISVFNVSLVP